MKNSFESANRGYDEHEKNLEKSVSELSKFMLDNLSRPGFSEFLKGEEIEKDQLGRWEERLEELIEKTTKRVGHRIDQDELLKAAYKEILNRKWLGELPESNHLDNFCNNLEELFK